MSKDDLESRLNRSMANLESELAEVEKRKDELEGKLEKLRELKSALDGLPPDLLSSLLEETEESESISDEALGTHFERIVDFLRDQGNMPQTIAAIESATGIPRASISAVLYRTHPHRFQSLPRLEHGKLIRAKVWRLAEDDDPFLGPTVDVPKSNVEDDIPF